MTSPIHDDDGNLTSDSEWGYTWDAENRLVGVARSAAALAAGAPYLREEHDYDFIGRRIRTSIFTTSGATTPASRTLFVFDGWKCVAELDALSSNQVARKYTWGLDLAGDSGDSSTGNVGALLWLVDTATNKTHIHLYDRNGNVSGLMDTTTRKRSATYDYDAFGQLTVCYGDYAKKNPFGFSTKYTDFATGLCYYGYRWYSPVHGRWPSRDPIEEKGGINLYGFVGNDGVSRQDRLGLDFIGVGKTNYVLHGITLHHAIVQYWKTCKKAGALNSWTTVAELKGKGLSDLKIEASTELKPDEGVSGNGYSSWVTFPAGSNHTIGKLYKNLWISYISNVPNIGLQLAVVSEGTDSEVAAKWEKIMKASSAYEFAEQTKGSTAKFPQSIYGSPEYSRPLGGNDFPSPIPFNNSNTFARHVLSQAAIDWAVITTFRFPGNSSPERVIGTWEKVTAN